MNYYLLRDIILVVHFGIAKHILLEAMEMTSNKKLLQLKEFTSRVVHPITL